MGTQPVTTGEGPSTAPGTAADAVLDRLRDQVAEIGRHEQAVRTGDPDPEHIHKMRVALRRLRSALATFRPLFDRDRTEPLRDEMRWIAGLLGGVRDLQVTHGRFRDVLSAESPEVVIGPVAQRIDEHLARELRAARDELDDAMRSQRYADLGAALTQLAERPPWRVEDAPDADAALMRKRVRKDWKRLRRAVEDAAASPPGRRSESLHEVRKAAKRVRYAAETVMPEFGEHAERLAAAAEDVQGILGDHHDRVTALPRLRAMGIAAHAEGESAFTFGRLHSA